MADKPDMRPAVVFYVIYVLGVILLAVLPNKTRAWARSRLPAPSLAPCATPLRPHKTATLSVGTRITVIDICWGTFLTAVGASAGYLAWPGRKAFG